MKNLFRVSLLIKSCFWLILIIATSEISLVTQSAASTPYKSFVPIKIKIPDDCSYYAIEEGAEIPFAHICARDMLHLNKLLGTTKLKDSCPNLTNFEQIGYGVSYDDFRLEFIAWGKNRFLLKIMCQNAAYNTSYIILLYEPEIITSSHLDDNAINIFRLLVFPFAGYEDGPVKLSPVIFLPYANFKTNSLYHYQKFIGMGTGGYYAKFGLDRQTLEPVLLQAISKPFNDYKDAYSFEATKIPQGKGWKSLSFPKGLKGMLLPIDQPNMDLDLAIASGLSRQSHLIP